VISIQDAVLELLVEALKGCCIVLDVFVAATVRRQNSEQNAQPYLHPHRLCLLRGSGIVDAAE
jgi:hypothetical protein